MKSNKLLILFLILALAAGCGGGGGNSSSNPPAKTLVWVSVTPTNPSLAKGTSQQFIATGSYSDNSTQDLTSAATWSSSNPSVATISNTAGTNGQATATIAGTASITATSENIAGTTTLTVTQATLQSLASLAVSPTNSTIVLGTTQQFMATGTYSDNSTQDLTTQVTWSSAATSIAVISNTGKATAGAKGTTSITATAGSVSATTTLTVTLATLQSLAVSPANPSIVLDATQQFTATGTYSDNSTQNLTTAVTWSSALPTVATISNAAGSNGLASSVAEGSSTITASSGNISGTSTLTVTGSIGGTNNVLPVTVNGSLCAADSYTNKPCVSVTVCAPGTSTCQTITDLLLDTGSYGLRIFKESLPLPMQQVMGNSGLANCVQFGDGSSLWGAVQTASVILGNEPAVTVSIQAVSSSFGAPNRPTACRNAHSSPAAAGFNGILGVGLFTQDCGATCVTSVNNGMYYSCNGSNCSGTTVALNAQIQNPVALLPEDNNGLIVELPSVPLGGVPSVNGRLVLGIDTQSNNASSGTLAYAAQNARFTTIFSGVSYTSSFIDSGSNGLFFSSPSASLLPSCTTASGWFCPPSTVSLSATNTTTSGHQIPVPFQIGNANSLFMSGNQVFVEMGGSLRGGFDWGLPFFLGRKVYVGFDQKNSLLGTGPYWAY